MVTSFTLWFPSEANEAGGLKMAKRLVLVCLALLCMATAIAAQDALRGDQEILVVADDTLSAALSGCGLCQQTGSCGHAFRGQPGQFCLILTSGLPCCCPQDAECVSNLYSCRCRRASYHSNPSVKTVTHTSSSSDTKSSTLWVVFAMLLCVVCCVMAGKSRQAEPEYAQPVYVTPDYNYGATGQNSSQPQYKYAYPTAPSAPYEYQAPGQQVGGGSSLAAGAAGAVAGLAGGMLIGSTFGGRGHEDTTTTTTYYDGDSGFNNSSTYDFSGDTGDYGGDDGGDFAGDS
ncbi:hypothetical protein Poli38472_012254 [Pythium oligandrum]|uniref:Uncharacterized protein n=1 Tax=Pythium oligandrum TaxID=41045 RepID=A0A8K1FR14_PYTOL|nr:hypothetical protein Poli38472_012254 [Pythium oligandrum]|eukprot:TMW67138.1 hypothetical protein Poli38472_012254 [Pythium oligandrum]